jgi:hypothetical protein
MELRDRRIMQQQHGDAGVGGGHGAAQDIEAAVAADSGSDEVTGKPVTSAATAAGGAAAPAAVGGGDVKKAVPVIVFWLVMSTATILFNKLLFTRYFRFPVTLTAVHMGFACLVTAVMRGCGYLAVPTLGWNIYMRNVAGTSVPGVCGPRFALCACARPRPRRCTRWPHHTVR